MDKILYFNGCSWPEGSELKSLRDLQESREEKCKYRCSSLLSSKLGYDEINESSAGKSHQDIIEETINFAYKNKSKSEDIIINVWLTSPERMWFYFGDKPFIFSPWMILRGICPHQTEESDWKEMKSEVTKFTKLWTTYFHNQKFFLHQYVRDVLLLYNTLQSLGYKFLITNAFYNFGNDWKHNLPFYEDSEMTHFDDLSNHDLWNDVVSKLPEDNFLFGNVKYSIKDKLLDLWELQKTDYVDTYDTSKLSSILVADDHEWKDKEPNYFFCKYGHPSELGHQKISEMIEKHYKEHEII